MLTLLGLLFAGFVSIVVLFGIGAAIYELYIMRQEPLSTRDYTRSYDWTTSE